MSTPLKDFRGKLTVETHCWLEALSRATGDDHQTIVREILHKWATEHLRASTIAQRLLAVEGITGNNTER